MTKLLSRIFGRSPLVLTDLDQRIIAHIRERGETGRVHDARTGKLLYIVEGVRS